MHRALIYLSIAALLTGCGDEAALKKEKDAAALGSRQEVTLRLAHATEATGDSAGAEKMYLQVAAQSPRSSSAQVELAEFYKRHRENKKAIESLNAALKLSPNDTALGRTLANAYIEDGSPEKALPLLNTAISANPKDPLLYNSRGVALDQTGAYGAAQQSYKQAYDLDPGRGSVYKINSSMSYILSGDYDKTIAVLRPMIDMPDAPPIARQNLALAYGLKGDSDAALALGLQDLSESEANENLRFYRMLSHPASQVSHNAPVPLPRQAFLDDGVALADLPPASGGTALPPLVILPPPILKPDAR